uniref:long-chain-fatty-acid--CoA ligase n=1 Tax=Aceria tosichella TaxID=561515 RepID=A0A6G1SA48_9ACAR
MLADSKTTTKAAACASKEAEASSPAACGAQTQKCSSSPELDLVKKFFLDCLLCLIKLIITTFDLISQPIYYYKHEVAKRRREVEHVRSKQVNPNDPESPWRQIDIAPHQVEIERVINSYETYDEMMKQSFLANQSYPCYGYRQVLEESWLKRPDNPEKLVRQVRLSDYKWCTYGQFESQIEACRRGLLLEGVRAGQRVILFADTRPEWQICSQALIRLGAIVGTMYSTLGVDGIIHTVNETRASLVITQRDKVGRLLRLSDRLPELKQIIYFETSLFLPRQLGGLDQADELKFLEAASGRLDNISEWQLSTTRKIRSSSTTKTSGSTKTTTMAASMMSNGFVDQASRNENSDKTEQDEEEEEQEGIVVVGKGGEEEGKREKQPADDAPALECSSFCKLLKAGLDLEPSECQRLEQANQDLLAGMPDARKKHSLAVIMYTSGSTGIPKGVLISHGNIMATVKSFSYVTKDFISNPKANICTAYLPLAHIFEFCIESVMLYHGVKFGFASPHTLTDKSPGLAPGQVGDLTKLKPTVMIIVPLILDRIVQGVKQALKAQSYFKEQLVSYLIDYKIYWQKRHYETPLVDKIVCSKMSTALGGRAKFVICGSAPLSSLTQTYVRAALNLKLPQGFGTTETCAATACQLFDDQSTANVGLPVSGAQIKLEPWLEGNYRPSDRPNPRGEIVVGGEMIAHGYYNLEEQTREAFYVDAQGVRWYRTGDIGEFLPNGQLKIIDRKKDLVKLQNGEYISLGRVESTLKSNPYTDNFCIYANSNYNYVIALGPANELAIKTLAQQIVDESERKLSPSMIKRMGASANGNSINHQKSHQNHLYARSQSLLTSGSEVGIAHKGALLEEKESLLMSDDERQLALDELKEVLASYESDLLNNNDNNSSINNNNERRGSLASANGGLQQLNNQQQQHHHKGRADSGLQPPPAASCVNERLNRLCRNKLILERVHNHINMMAKERNLLSLEVPKKLLLIAEEWTEDKNLVTAALKIRRNYIYKRYENELEQIYAA